VFRYALEHWPAEPFQVVVFQRSARPDPATSAFVGALNEAAEAVTNRANVHTIIVRVDKWWDHPREIPEEFRSLWAKAKTENLPWAVALFSNVPSVVWAGKPTLENARRLLDSPARTKIANYIMQGASAVWVLLESGDRQKDDQARALLTETLSKAEKSLDLPEILPEDRERYLAAGGPELKVWFPLLSVSRKDPQEQFFVQMLCRTEDNIPADSPVAFPIFGQGRLLGAFHGDLLNADEIEGACAFLTGMCSCQVKEMYPGTDLLFTARWHRLFRDMTGEEPMMPDLVGTTKPEGSDAAMARQRETERPTTSAIPASSGRAILRNVLLAGGLCVVGVLAVSLILWLKWKRERP
jgi:hypothetical protein